MKRVIITLCILILGLSYAVQDKGTTQVLNPQFKGTELSIPKSINFQGYLYRDGTPMDTTMDMWFGIYDSPSGSNILFQQSINNVEVTNGWFTVSLINIPNLVFPISGPTRYLAVKAPSSGPALEPRIPLLSVAYSYHSITSDSAKYLILPCTLQAAIAYPEAILNINNNGDGIGIKIDEARYGISIDSARSFGVYIRKSDGDGIYIRNAGGDGIFVNNVDENGVNVHNASKDGIHIRRVDSSGVFIEQATYGVWIDSSFYDGVRIKKTGLNGDGVNIDEAGRNGFSVINARGYGTLVGWVGADGHLVYDANASGFHVYHADSCGVRVNEARHGMIVDSVGMNGIWIYKVGGGNGLRVDDASVSGVLVCRVDNDGFRVDSAGWRGVYIARAGWDGLYVSQASENGVFINNAGANGVEINRADEKGVHVDSTGIGFSAAYTQIGLKIDAANHQGIYIDNTGWAGVQVFNSYEDGIIGRGWWSGGRFVAAVQQARGILAYAYNSVATDTAIQAYGRGYATGGWYTGGLKGNQEAPCIISPDLTIIASGSARLSDSKAKIFYPEVFIENVRSDIPIRLSITPIDNPTGLLYAKKDGSSGFNVTLKMIPGWDGENDIAFDWIAIGTLKEYETSPEAKTEWEEMMSRMEERRKEIKEK